MACCCTPPPAPKHDHKFKIVLWLALILNLTMFLVEILGGLYTHSSSLWADALDFFGDSANYAISLAVIGLSLYWRATAALIKGLTMLIFAGIVIGKTVFAYFQGIPPEPIAMGMIALLALVVNIVCALLLYKFRSGDANMQSVWLCSRNDAIANIAVIFAAIGVFGTGSILPDFIVAMIMAVLGISAGITIVRLAIKERKGQISTTDQCC
ncbi:cation transporter [Acinetobacter qingfengensis]|uniref:Cobalt transporter n=1 Tax=Acinetobacter qingfengensis TaxID=1262585 RepID=A0A1E7RCF7_9GAMM|nr:cation transporter [Acinetobacter qingfengensis]KAA8734967.1 cation transporter [Acinetobacter qingfengensis]OEY97054.1 cobalt transporter [Acinetobacter qingfengensis]